MEIVSTLGPEDMVVQSMPDASPVKWHLAHTTWFFETFILGRSDHYTAFDESYGYLFNSYYDAIGPRHPRTTRGLVTRPVVQRIVEYRNHVDAHVNSILQSSADSDIAQLIELGIAHEEQHQELILMDILHLFSSSMVLPAVNPRWPTLSSGRRGEFVSMTAGMQEVGHAGDGFAFDHEGPRHKVYLHDYEISDRLVTNAEWMEFIKGGGYVQPRYWLADGWAVVQSERWDAPLYWVAGNDGWLQMTLRGLEPVDPGMPITHVSYYEAAAFANWAEARLPTEFEWEVAAHQGLLEQVSDTAWQWTQSAFSAYPGFRPAQGAIGEYNGKFMINVMVLRGGANITPPDHTRITYRNFFGPDKRWMSAGVRLARDSAALDFLGTTAGTDEDALLLDPFQHQR
jgi:ergothioneine biosynthesis protein EgtB